MSDLLTDLRNTLGADYVLTDPEVLTPYTKDATGKYVGTALAVVRPANAAEVSAIVKLANTHGTPVIPQGGNTGLAGACFTGDNRDTIILSLERLNTIRDIKPDARIAIVEAGVILQTLHTAAEQHGLIYPMTFGAKGSCMIGGNLGTNAGGSNVLRYGNTRDLVLGIEAVMPNGDIVDLMSELHKDNTGYNLKHLMIGAEGTLGIITAAVLKLAPKPKAYFTAMVAVPDISTSLTLLNTLQAASRNSVEAYEYMPDSYFQALASAFPDARMPFEEPAEHGIFVEVGFTADEDCEMQDDGTLRGVAVLEGLLEQAFEEGQITDAVICKSEGERQVMWENRERAYFAMTNMGKPVNNDIALPLDRVEEFITVMGAKLKGLNENFFALTVAHLGDGNLHYSVWLDPEAEPDVGPENHDHVMELVEDCVLEMGGSFSAEHGIGLTKLPSMRRRKDQNALTAMRAIKAALDPNGIMNPGKVLPAE
jgi:FAD/FMN-containing dehydrogenase